MIKFIEKLEKAALVGKNINLTYNELLDQIDHYATLINEMQNQRIVIFSENRPEWIMLCMPYGRQEGIVVPLMYFLPAKMCLYLHDCTPDGSFLFRRKTGICHAGCTGCRHGILKF